MLQTNLKYLYQCWHLASFKAMWRYQNLSLAAWQQVQGQLRAKGLVVGGHAGILQGRGISLQYHYEPATQQLQLWNLQISAGARLLMGRQKLVAMAHQILLQYGAVPMGTLHK